MDTEPTPPPDDRGSSDSGIDASRALRIARDLMHELGPQTPDTHAIVGMRDDGDSVALVDVALASNGVLSAGSGTDGIVVVTSSPAAGDGDGSHEPSPTVHHVFCVLPAGDEAGVARTAADDSVREWFIDALTHGAVRLRPTSVPANSARRAFGLPSLLDAPVDVADCLARAWLALLADAALSRFDGPDGPRTVGVDELERSAVADPFGGDPQGSATQETATAATDDRVTGTMPTWPQLRAAAATGEFPSLGIDPDLAAWLDDDGFAQVVDEALAPLGQLLESLRITCDEHGVDWAIRRLGAAGLWPEG